MEPPGGRGKQPANIVPMPRIGFLGPSVGKSALVTRIMHDTFIEEFDPTSTSLAAVYKLLLSFLTSYGFIRSVENQWRKQIVVDGVTTVVDILCVNQSLKSIDRTLTRASQRYCWRRGIICDDGALDPDV